MAHVLAPTHLPPCPSWPGPAAARKMAVWPTRKTAGERRRQDRKTEGGGFGQQVPEPGQHPCFPQTALPEEGIRRHGSA